MSCYKGPVDVVVKRTDGKSPSGEMRSPNGVRAGDDDRIDVRLRGIRSPRLTTALNAVSGLVSI